MHRVELCNPCLLDTLAIPAKTVEQIDMPSVRADSCGHKGRYYKQMRCALAPPGEYDEMVCAAAAMRAVAAISVATYF